MTKAELLKFAARRERIEQLVREGKPRSTVARMFKISRQRVYQLTEHIVLRPGRVG